MKPNQIIITLLAVIVLLLISFNILTFFHNPKPLTYDNGVATSTAPTPTPTPTSAMTNDKSEGKYYSIDLTYPNSSAAHLPEIKAYVDATKSDFLNNIVPKTDQEAEMQGLGGGRGDALTMTSKIQSSANTTTYIIETYTDSGGAHGDTDTQTFTYDKNGKYITLSDLLISPDSLTKLSTMARTYFYAKIKSQSDTQTINTGTAPKMENFSRWYITDQNITFIFVPYAVASYALGAQEYPLSIAQARTILKL